jgi:hypothetical protein
MGGGPDWAAIHPLFRSGSRAIDAKGSHSPNRYVSGSRGKTIRRCEALGAYYGRSWSWFLEYRER